jgi:hypothetical protein
MVCSSCEADGRRRITVAQDWTDRGVAASADRLAVEGLSVARALIDKLDPTLAVEPETGSLRGLDSRWEVKLAAFAEAEAALATARAVKPPLPAREGLRALAADLPRLWDAPTTSPRDRKRLLRTPIADVTLLLEQDSDAVRIGVRWHTGASDELTVERRGPGCTPPEALAIVRQYGATHYNWLRHGQVPARVRAGRWCIPWDAETQEVYRQKVANSFRLRPNPPACSADDAAHIDAGPRPPAGLAYGRRCEQEARVCRSGRLAIGGPDPYVRADSTNELRR